MHPAIVAPLPLDTELETPPVLRQLARAHRYLAELKGMAESIPNEAILISTLLLQEAKQSSDIENIITTQDDLWRGTGRDRHVAPAVKEVYSYAAALIA